MVCVCRGPQDGRRNDKKVYHCRTFDVPAFQYGRGRYTEVERGGFGRQTAPPLVEPLDRPYCASGNNFTSHKSATDIAYHGIKFTNSGENADLGRCGHDLSKEACSYDYCCYYGPGVGQSYENVTRKCEANSWILLRKNTFYRDSRH